MKTFAEIIDYLDAAVFTGEHLLEEKNRIVLKGFCERWIREIKRHQSENEVYNEKR